MDSQTQMRVTTRVEWWIRDAAYKPPELLSPETANGLWYMNCMARDILDTAANKLDFTWSSQRLDPPAHWKSAR